MTSMECVIDAMVPILYSINNHDDASISMVIFVAIHFIVEQWRHTVSNILITTDSNIFLTNADLLLI